MARRLSYLFGILSFFVVLAYGNDAKAQVYPGWYPYNNGYYFGFNYGAGSTAGGSYLLGYAEFMRSLGAYNLQTAEAERIYQLAYREYLDNQFLRAQTYFQLRQMNEDYRRAQRRPPMTAEQRQRILASQRPPRLASEQWNSESGGFNWPLALRDEVFADQRLELEKLFLERQENPEASGLESENYLEVKSLTDDMLKVLKARIRSMDPKHYLSATKFLRTLAYEARFTTEQKS